jgi:hypothetical protein
MRINFDGELVEPLFDAIKASPFSASLKALLISEVLTAPGLRWPSPGYLGLFDSRDIATSVAGDATIKVKLAGPGERMLAALRALCAPAENVSLAHADTPIS